MLARRKLDEAFELRRHSERLLLFRRDHAHVLIDALSESAENPRASTAMSRSGRAAHRIISYPGGRAFLRQYWHGGLLRFLTRDCILRHRVLHEIQVTETLRQRGVKVPLVLGAIIQPLLWPFCKATLVVREIEGAVNLAAYLQDDDRGRNQILEKRIIIDKCAQQIRHLHDLGVQHRDLNLRNVVVKSGKEPQAHLIDFDKARVEPKIRKRMRIDNILRLKRSLDKLRPTERLVLTQSDELRFLKAYGAPDPDFLTTFWRAYRWYRRGLPLRRLWWRVVYE